MKKVIIILFAVLLSSTIYGRVPTKFKGVSLNASFSKMKKMLNKKFKFVMYADKNDISAPVYEGRFAGYDVILVAKSFKYKTAYIAVLITIDESNWEAEYTKIIRQLTYKYGKSSKHAFEFMYPYTRDDNYNYQAITSKKTLIYTLWENNYYDLIVQIQSTGKIMIRYSNALVFNLWKIYEDNKQRSEF